MKTVIALAILCSVATARADDCKATGKPLFTIDTVDMGKVTSSTKLYDNGAWTVDATSGCADKAVAPKVKTLMAKAPWTISHPVHCMIATSKWTNYYTGDKLLFSERACNPDKLDDVSENTLAEIIGVVTAATQPTATGCKPTGNVVFQIKHNAVPAAKLTTSSMSVFATGAWMYTETTADGKPGKLKGGCLDKAQQTRIEDDVKAAPWKVTIPRVRCMARSQTFVEYSVQGKVVFMKQVCGNSLDDDSAKKLDDIEHILAKLAP
ncbi:MAG TPA: hypothetical protein VGO00_07485 [Kofleriaceae bacterium]|jgi:hypothetical protein|nr:hypothetical protein [Kofleriaceae bacterium]